MAATTVLAAPGADGRARLRRSSRRRARMGVDAAGAQRVSVRCPSGVRQTTQNDQERQELTIGEIPCPVWRFRRIASDLKTLDLPSHGRGHWFDPSSAHA